MTNMIKTNIRLRKVAERLNKDKLPKGWSPTKKRLFKLNERRNRYSKWVDDLWGFLYKKGFRPGIDNTNPKFEKEFEEINSVMTERDKIVSSIERTEKRHCLDSDSLQVEFNRYNTSRRTTSY